MVEKTEIIKVGGFMPSMIGMRLPTQSKGDSRNINGTFVLGSKDRKLARGLLNKKEQAHWTEDDYKIFQGDTHGKFQRSIIAWLDITVPRKIWSELDTYVVGVAPTSSTSTMYTLKKEIKDIDSIGREYFDDETDDFTIETFKMNLKHFEEKYGSIKETPIGVLKSSLPDGWLQRRVKAFSYQSLRRLYLQRKKHRLPGWQNICNVIESLPYADELLFGK